MISYLSLGSNLGNREQNLRDAIRLVGEKVGTVLRQSEFHKSEPWGFASENLFLNACIAVETKLTPRQLLTATQQIERRLGRKEKSVGGEYQDRLIDIDILLYGNEAVNEPDLQIPHPLMNERDFVLIPLKEIKEDE